MKAQTIRQRHLPIQSQRVYKMIMRGLRHTLARRCARATFSSIFREYGAKTSFLWTISEHPCASHKSSISMSLLSNKRVEGAVVFRACKEEEKTNIL